MIYQMVDCPTQIEPLLKNMALSSRIATACNVAHDYAAGSLASKDHELAELLIKFLINDSHSKVRAAISENLHDSIHLQQDIAFQLAMDTEKISLPILQTSKILEEAELVEILISATQNKQTAIAKRKNLTIKVTDHITQFCAKKAVKACLLNPTAPFSPKGFEQIMLRYIPNNDICNLLINRSDIPEETLAQLCQKVSETQKHQLIQEKGAPYFIAGQIDLNEKEHVLACLLLGRKTVQEKRKAAKQLDADGRLTFTLLLRSLILGDKFFFCAGLSQISNCSIKRVSSLFSEQNYLGLKSLLKKASVPAYLCAAFNVTMNEIKKSHLHGDDGYSTSSQTIIANRISKIYNYETDLSVKKVMEKLIRKTK